MFSLFRSKNKKTKKLIGAGSWLTAIDYMREFEFEFEFEFEQKFSLLGAVYEIIPK